MLPPPRVCASIPSARQSSCRFPGHDNVLRRNHRQRLGPHGGELQGNRRLSGGGVVLVVAAVVVVLVGVGCGHVCGGSGAVGVDGGDGGRGSGMRVLVVVVFSVLVARTWVDIVSG